MHIPAVCTVTDLVLYPEVLQHLQELRCHRDARVRLKVCQELHCGAALTNTMYLRHLHNIQDQCDNLALMLQRHRCAHIRYVIR